VIDFSCFPFFQRQTAVGIQDWNILGFSEFRSLCAGNDLHHSISAAFPVFGLAKMQVFTAFFSRMLNFSRRLFTKDLPFFLVLEKAAFRFLESYAVF
jgi:hypothetical protein